MTRLSVASALPAQQLYVFSNFVEGKSCAKRSPDRRGWEFGQIVACGHIVVPVHPSTLGHQSVVAEYSEAPTRLSVVTLQGFVSLF